MASFALDLSKWCEKVGDRADLLVRKVALDMGSNVISRSPVDTGRFRGNWQVGLNSRPGGTVASLDTTGAATIGKVTGELQAARAGQVVYFANNLPYSVKLEYGHSKQAPGGMVRITVAEFQQTVNEALSEAKAVKP